MNITLSRRLPASILTALFGLLPLIYWPSFFEAATLPRNFAIAMVVFLSLTLAWRHSSVTFLHKPTGNILVVGLLAWSAISLFWSVDPDQSRIRLLQIVPLLLLALVAPRLVSPAFFARRMLPFMLAGATLAALIGLGQHWNFNPLGLRLNNNQIASTFLNRNHAANYFDFFPALGLALLLVTRSHWRWAIAISLGSILGFIVLNKSRGSLLALIVSCLGIAIMVVCTPSIRHVTVCAIRSRLKPLLLALLIPAILITIPPSSDETVRDWRLSPLIQKKQLDKSSKIRLAIYVNSIPAILDHPLTGVGLGATRAGIFPYTTAFMPIPFRTEDVVLAELHNDFLQAFLELGLPGGLLLIAIILLALKQGYRFLSTSPSSSQKIIVLGLLGALLASLTHALVDFPLQLPSSAVIFWLIIGLLLGHNQTFRASQSTSSLIRLSNYLLPVVGIAGLSATFLSYPHQFNGNSQLRLASYYLQKKECLPAAKASHLAMDTFPEDFRNLTIHAQVYTACSFPNSIRFEEMNRILSRDPTILRARLTRANLLNQAKRSEQAIRDFVLVAKAIPHRPTAYAGLGDAYRLLGEKMQAVRFYRAALRRKPNYKYALMQLKKLEKD